MRQQAPEQDQYGSAYELYQRGRDLMAEGQFQGAVPLLEQSAQLVVHFKTLELLGECFMSLGRWSEAAVPLAAATTLNRSVRAPSLLAEVLLKLEDWGGAKEIAEVALSRDPHNRTARRVRDQVASRLTT